MADTPHHQSYLTLTQSNDGLVVPTLVRPELSHVQKFIYPDQERDEAQLSQLRPYRYFAALINACPSLKTFETVGALVVEGLKHLNRVPANELIDILLTALRGGAHHPCRRIILRDVPRSWDPVARVKAKVSVFIRTCIPPAESTPATT